VPGIRRATLCAGAPLGALAAPFGNTRVSAPAAGAGAKEISCPVFRDRVGTGFFAALGAPLVRGREFTAEEHTDLPPDTAIPAILNHSAARELFGAADPIGRSVREEGAIYTVVGVVRDVRSGYLPPKPVRSLFLPLTADWLARSHAPRATLLARGTPGRPTLAAVRDELARLHPDLTIFDVQTLQSNLDEMNAFVNSSSTIYAVLGLFAVLLACIGVGGVTAYTVARRRREIGIRMALGARAGQIRALMLREGIALIAAGTICGFAGTAAAARALSALNFQVADLFQTRMDDPLLVFGAPSLVAMLTLLACHIPTWMGTRIDPAAALREQ
jgi:ABC-type antimicrobial peptide transport system permease subunit